MKIITSFAAASVLAFSGAVMAEQQLSTAQMDGVTAGGIADGVATADAHGADALALTNVDAISEAVELIEPQFGNFWLVLSEVDATSEAAAGGAAALSNAHGFTAGDFLSDTFSQTQAVADRAGVTMGHPLAAASAANASVAQSLIAGAEANSASQATASLME